MADKLTPTPSPATPFEKFKQRAEAEGFNVEQIAPGGYFMDDKTQDAWTGWKLCMDQHEDEEGAEVERLAAQAAPTEPKAVVQAGEYPPLPEGVKARFKCEDCDGTGYTGDMIPGSEFQPPEPVGCTSCNFTGWWAECEAYSADQMHAYLDAGRALAVETARMLTVELASEREITANLTRALRKDIEPPIFMGEPVTPPKPVGFVVLDHFGPNKHLFSSFYDTRNSEHEWAPVFADRASSGAAQAVRMLTDAARDVPAERQRQISAEGWTPEHDDEHAGGSLAKAAACYALHSAGRDAWGAQSYQAASPPMDGPADEDTLWPWDRKWWKPKSQRADLVRAGALILAELERLDRAGRTIPADGKIGGV